MPHPGLKFPSMAGSFLKKANKSTDSIESPNASMSERMKVLLTTVGERTTKVVDDSPRSKSALALLSVSSSRDISCDKDNSYSSLVLDKRTVIDIADASLDEFAILSNMVMSNRPIKITVSVQWQNQVFVGAIHKLWDANKLLKDVIAIINGQKANSEEPDRIPAVQTEQLVLTKVDTQIPGIRHSLMEKGNSYISIESGDILDLFSLNQELTLDIAVVSGETQTMIKFIVSVAATPAITISNFEKEHPELQMPNAGFYYPRFGMWIEGEKLLLNYNISAQDSLQYRTKANQVILRIYLQEFDFTFAIKALQNQRIADVQRIIDYQCLNRKYVHSNTQKTYGLFVASARLWMSETEPLSKYMELLEKVH
jgi:hypothetical protein